MTRQKLMKAKEKITKLLKLAEDEAATPEEAALAAQRAQELMLKYNIDLAQIDTGEDGTEGEDIETTLYDLHSVGDTGRMIKWKRILLTVIAKHNFTQAVYMKNSSLITIIGQPHNTEFVQYLYEYLVPQLERMGEDAYYADPWARHRSRFLQSFYVGAINVIGQRLEAQVHQASVDPAAGAIITQKQADLMRFMQQRFSNLKTGKGLPVVVDTIVRLGGLTPARAAAS